MRYLNGCTFAFMSPRGFTQRDGWKTSLRLMKEQTGCDGVMIGRACQGNPFIFREIRQALEGKEITPKTNEEVANIAARHLEMICREKGEMIGILEMRKHLGWYSHSMRGSPTFRNKCNLATTFQEMMELTKWLADPKEE